MEGTVGVRLGAIIPKIEGTEVGMVCMMGIADWIGVLVTGIVTPPPKTQNANAS